MKINIIGKKFGRLTVLSFSHYDKAKERNYWNCLCECGNEVVRSTCDLKSSKTPSCGCYKKERATKGLNKKHDLTGTKLYNLWKDMKKRTKTRKSYIKLNIKVCEDWKNNPIAFVEWAKSHGYKEGLQLDRIDTYGNYSPENCRFVTSKINNNNRTNNIIVNFNGVNMTLAQASEKSGIKYTTLKSRYHKNGLKNLFLSKNEYRNRGF